MGSFLIKIINIFYYKPEKDNYMISHLNNLQNGSSIIVMLKNESSSSVENLYFTTKIL